MFTVATFGREGGTLGRGSRVTAKVATEPSPDC